MGSPGALQRGKSISMKLTPLDIHHKEFRVALRGYNQEEVDAFLDEVADEFERLFKENIDLSEKYDAAAERIRSYVEMETTLHNTMLAAQQSAEEVKGKAAKEAELLLRDAEIKAKELVQAALAQKQKTQSEFMRIKQVEDDFRMAFRNLLEDQMRSLHSIPIANDVAEMVGIAQDAAGGAPAAPKAPAQAVAPPAAPQQVAAPAAPAQSGAAPADAPTEGASYAQAVAAAAAPPAEGEGGAARPRAQVARRETEDTEPGAAAPAPAVASVQSVQLGELGSPDLGPEPPTYSDPPEFTPGRFGAGEREEDLDIEEID